MAHMRHSAEEGLMYTFAELLRGFRKREGLSQYKLAEALPISPATVSTWERSHYLPDSREKVLVLAQTLHLDEHDRDQLLVAANFLPVGHSLKEDQRSSFGELLTAFRTRPGISQKVLASRLGVNVRTVSAWENGDNLPKNREAVLALAKALQLSVEGRDQLLSAANFPSTELPPRAEGQVIPFGELLKQFRARQGMSQRKLGEELGVHHRTIGAWERGATLPKTRGMVLDIAK